MEWEFENLWEVGFSRAEQYYRGNGNLNVPVKYRCEDESLRGLWIANQKTNIIIQVIIIAFRGNARKGWKKFE